MKKSVQLIFAALLLTANIACAADVDKRVPEVQSQSDLSNIGFMKKPPKHLTERFPMCDVFLKVKWIDKEKKIGYSNYEAIMKSKDGAIKERKMVWALVNMKGNPGIDFDVYQYKQNGRLNEVFEMVKKGEVSLGVSITVTYKGKSMSFYQGAAWNYDANQPLLSDHQHTVCVVYPDEKHAWIAEGKRVKDLYSSKEQDGLYNRITFSLGENLPKSYFENLFELDVNLDGKADYINNQTAIYSVPSGFNISNRKSVYPNFLFSFPPSEQTCLLKNAIYVLSTDGKNYFLDSQCNLTELTSSTEKE